MRNEKETREAVFFIESILNKDIRLDNFYRVSTLREFRIALSNALQIAYKQGYDDTKSGKLM